MLSWVIQLSQNLRSLFISVIKISSMCQIVTSTIFLRHSSQIFCIYFLILISLELTSIADALSFLDFSGTITLLVPFPELVCLIERISLMEHFNRIFFVCLR